MSISSPFRLISRKLPQYLNPSIPVSKYPTPSTSLIPSHNSLIFRSISFQRLPTRPPSSSSSSSVSLQPIEELPPKLQEIVKLFQGVEEPKAKYQQLLFYGQNLTPLDSRFKTSENKVQGCVSQVWVRAFLDSDNTVRFEADSDSVLTKGLAALLVQGLSGLPVRDILQVSPDFAVLLGLQQSLTPSRNNGFLNMLKMMQKKALLLFMEAENGAATSSVENPVNNSVVELNSESYTEVSAKDFKSNSTEIGEKASDLGSRGERIRERLKRVLRPVELQVEDISYQHAGHAGVRGSEGETHFNVRIVSEEFQGKSMVKRHRLVYDLLQDELQTGLHALSIVAKTPSEVNGG